MEQREEQEGVCSPELLVLELEHWSSAFGSGLSSGLSPLALLNLKLLHFLTRTEPLILLGL